MGYGNSNATSSRYNLDFDNDDDHNICNDHPGNKNDDCVHDTEIALVPTVEKNVQVCWPEDDQYCFGVGSGVNESGQHVMSYGNDDTETLMKTNTTWRYESTTIFHATTFPTRKADTSNMLQEMLCTLDSESFKLHHAKAFPQYFM